MIIKNTPARLGRYLVLTFTISWLAWWGEALVAKISPLTAQDSPALLAFFLGGFGLAIAACLCLPGGFSLKGLGQFLTSHRPKTLPILAAFAGLLTLFFSGLFNRPGPGHSQGWAGPGRLWPGHSPRPHLLSKPRCPHRLKHSRQRPGPVQTKRLRQVKALDQPSRGWGRVGQIIQYRTCRPIPIPGHLGLCLWSLPVRNWKGYFTAFRP